MWISYTLYDNYQCIYYEYVCAWVPDIFWMCMDLYIDVTHVCVYMCEHSGPQKWGDMDFVASLIGWCYFGTFIGCWKDKCEVPNNPLGRRAIGRNTSFHNNSPHQKEDMLNVFAWAGTFCPHEPPPWNLSINTCTGESNAAKRELCWIAIFSKLQDLLTFLRRF